MVAGPSRSRLPPGGAPSLDELYRQAKKMRKVKRQATDPDEHMTSAGFFIPSLPGQPQDAAVTMYGGHMPVSPVSDSAQNEDDGHIFFFLVRNKHIAETERTVLWFNGGPGCSSFDGLMMEIGPFRLDPAGGNKLLELDGAWNEYANVLFIDQPVGTGYSYVSETDKYIHELQPAADQLVNFLQRFYSVFPEFASHDTYLSGESFAGQYIPYFASAILETTKIPTKLKGVLIGNGWIDPASQYPAYYDFALQAGVIKEGTPSAQAVKNVLDLCTYQLGETQGGNVHVHNGPCESVLGAITTSTLQSVNGQQMCVNNYDVRLTDASPACGMNWPPDLHNVYEYLQDPKVKTAFHADRKTEAWVECNGAVGGNFYVASSPPSITLFPDLLTKIPILLFAGDQDLICNYLGMEYLAKNLEWNGEKGWGEGVTAQDWFVGGKAAGTWISARNLTFVKVFDASHMVPYDKPLEAHDMLLRFIGVNLLGAAGPAAQVPSKVGDEQEAVVGETHVNGSAVAPLVGDDKTGSSTSTIFAGDSFETIVSAGSAVIILLVVLVAIFVFFVCRKRIMSKKGSGPILGHGRTTSLGRGQHLATDEDEPHELDELVVDRDYRDKSDKDDYKPVKSGSNGHAALQEPEEIFDVGSTSDEEEDRKHSDATR